MGALINRVSNKLCLFGNFLRHFLKVVLKLDTSRIFLKQDAGTPLVHMLIFDDKNRQIISNGKHMLYLNFSQTMIDGTAEIRRLKIKVMEPL